MTQEELLEFIRAHPGILQSALRKLEHPEISNYGDVSGKLHALRMKKYITRIPYKSTWKLYPHISPAEGTL